MPEILNIIHLEKRLDRLQNLLEQTNQQNIAFKIWIGDESTNNPVININLAHKSIVKFAKEQKLPYIRIAEDDLRFTSPNAWKYYLSKMPKVFDLYCGVLYKGNVNDSGRISNGLSAGLTLYTIAESFYDTFLQTDNALNLDWALNKLSTIYNYYACTPFVVIQNSGYSDHFKRQMNYDAYLLDKKLYGQ